MAEGVEGAEVQDEAGVASTIGTVRPEGCEFSLLLPSFGPL